MTIFAGVFVFVAAGLTAPRFAAIETQASSPTVREYLAHQLEGSGVWRQDNPAFVPGGDQARFWERVVRNGPDPQVVTADARAVMENGSCQFLAHIVYWWDADANAVAASNYAAGNVRFSGKLVRVDGAWVLESTGRIPDGTNVRFRDTPGFTRPDAYSTIGFRWDGTDWVRQDESVWQRAPEGVC